MPITLNGDTGIQTPMYNGTITANAVTPSVNMKNRIINGEMVIDQRNAGASVTPTVDVYTLDRWQAECAVASKYSVQQNAGSVTPPAGFTNYLGATSTSAYSVGSGDFFSILQIIEGYNIADFGWGTANAKTVTISFWVRSSLTGTFGGAIENNGATRCYPFSYTISAANTWEQKSVTVAGDTSGTWNAINGRGLVLRFSLGVGSTYAGTAGAWGSTRYFGVTGQTQVVGTNGATFYITGVQLEVGSTATIFDYRPYGTELALCQRYFQRSYDIGTATGTSFNSNYEIPAYFIGTGNYGFVCSKTFLTSMRGTPTITVYSDDGIAGRVTPWNSSSVGIAYVNAIQNGITAGNFNNNTGVGVVYGFAYVASAEL